MLRFTAHASQSVLKCWPNGTNPLDQYRRGEPLDKELVWQITQRQPQRTVDDVHYVLSADKAGIFVVTATGRVITVLRMGETQRRILAGQSVDPAPHPPAQPKRPKPAPDPAPQTIQVATPADADLFLTFEFFPITSRSVARRMAMAQVGTTCSVCDGQIQPGSWHMRVKIKTDDPTAASLNMGRVCMTCLEKRKAEVWDE